MKTFSIDDIRSWRACYDPIRYLPEKWSGTALDILSNVTIPENDRIWVVLRLEVMTPQDIQEFLRWTILRANEKSGNSYRNYAQADEYWKSVDQAERIEKLTELISKEDL
jgi:hypothetical protein